MVVKSATKKRLIELGVPEEYAHKLATNRNMSDIKSLSHEDIATILGISKDSEEFSSTMITIAEQGSRRRKNKQSKKITIRARALDEIDKPEITRRFNAMNHELVPHQELVGPANVSAADLFEIEMAELAPWQLLEEDEETGEPRLAKELLPKILISDPVVQVIKELAEAEDADAHSNDADYKPLAAGWISDRVLKVVRKSPSAGQSVAYRLIVEGN